MDDGWGDGGAEVEGYEEVDVGREALEFGFVREGFGDRVDWWYEVGLYVG